MKVTLSTSVCRAQGGRGAEEGRVPALQELPVLGVSPQAITQSSGNKSILFCFFI